MPGNKVLTAFTQDGSIVTDKKAYIKHDFLISDQLGWLAPPLQPTRTFGWTKEGSRPRLLGTEYILTSAPASPERNAPLIHTLGKVWEDGLNGIKVKKGNVSDSFKLQLFIATAGGVFLHRNGKRLVRYLPDIPDTGNTGASLKHYSGEYRWHSHYSQVSHIVLTAEDLCLLLGANDGLKLTLFAPDVLKKALG